MDLYWRSIASLDWDDPNNWKQFDGSAGHVPLVTDNVFFDGGGYVLCWNSTSPIAANSLTLEVTATEMAIFEQGGTIAGDFVQHAGYFGGTGGGGYVLDFQGQFLYDGGTFSIGTGTGVDLTCEFSASGGVPIINNNLAAASFQHVHISGELECSGTRLAVMNIQQTLTVTGELSIAKDNWVMLFGEGLALPGFIGTITGEGLFFYDYTSTSVLPSTGTINCAYFTIYVMSPTVTVQPREWDTHVKIEYNDNQTVQFSGPEIHYFKGQLTIYGDSAGITNAILDWDTETAQTWFDGVFNIDPNAFPNATFNIKLGDGMQVFRTTIDLYFSYASVTTQLIVDPGEGVLILYPKGIRQVPLVP